MNLSPCPLLSPEVFCPEGTGTTVNREFKADFTAGLKSIIQKHYEIYKEKSRISFMNNFGASVLLCVCAVCAPVFLARLALAEPQALPGNIIAQQSPEYKIFFGSEFAKWSLYQNPDSIHALFSPEE